MADGVFLDTFGLLALLNQDDDYHRQAESVFRNIGESNRPVVTTNVVLAEVGNGLARTNLREEAAWLIRQLHADPRSTVVYVDPDEFEKGLALYVARPDKAWGLIDCVSFVAMDRLGLVDAFTADHHFAQAGLHCLLSPIRRR